MSAAMPPDALHRARTMAIDQRDRHAGPVGVGDRRELEDEEVLHLLGEGGGDVLDLAGDVVGVGHEPVDRHERDERRHEREERVEGDAGGDQREVVLADAGLRRVATDRIRAASDSATPATVRRTGCGAERYSMREPEIGAGDHELLDLLGAFEDRRRSSRRGASARPGTP